MKSLKKRKEFLGAESHILQRVKTYSDGAIWRPLGIEARFWMGEERVRVKTPSLRLLTGYYHSFEVCMPLEGTRDLV